MNDLRIREHDSLRPLHVVMICLVVMTVAGGSLLLSAAEPAALVDGAIAWQAESPLRAVVQLLCLNYQVPTIYAGDVKNYILGIGAGLAILTLGFAIAASKGPGGEEVAVDADYSSKNQALADKPPEAPMVHLAHRPHIAPLVAAQVLVGLYLLWSFASSRWSSASELAIGGSILVTIQFFWAFGVGNGLNASGARLASRAIIAVAVVTSAVAIWYYYGRNPTLRAKFPFGNPTFLAACLIPGILLAGGLACEKIAHFIETRRAKPIVLAVLVFGAVGITLWAFRLADSRGSYVGLLFGGLAMVFFALRGRTRLIPAFLAAGAAVLGWIYYSNLTGPLSPTGRSTTLRLRTYAWDYAWRMFNEKPFTGHGHGGFVLAGDSYTVGDVLNDPLVFEYRIAHAHNEWLEVMADLGSVGIVLLAAALLLTFWAGRTTLAASPPRGQRWALVGLMGALVGLIVEESFGVGLRVSGVPTLFYTVIGLIWALSSNGMSALACRLSASSGRRIVTGVVGGLAGLAILAVTHQDFAAAGNVYQAEDAFRKGDYEGAIRLAQRAPNRLNPQRALTNLYRLSEAHARAAQHLQDRAGYRERRAHEAEPPNRRLMALARDDYRLSDEHCEKSSGALKELVVRSPGYINHGWLEYRLNLVRARNAAVRNELEKEQALLQNAAAAIQRELLRQPFDASITVDYLRVAGPTLDLAQALEVLARPLRHHRISESYMDLLRRLAADPEFDRHFEPTLEKARSALTSPPIDEQTGQTVETWAPEKLRIAAAIHFIRGDYQAARGILELAAPAYDALALSAPFGAASCHAELAICRFFSEPGDPAPALAEAVRSIALAPDSRLGRELKRAVKQRMVDYHLAGDNEEEAKRLLRETGPTGVTEDAVLAELGARYRQMCDSLLGRREPDGILRKPPSRLLPELQRWIGRALELNPYDASAHYLAANLAFHAGDDEATANYLQHAVDNGLPVEAARQFLQQAWEKRPDSPALMSLWAKLAPTPTSRQPSDEPQRSPEAQPTPAAPDQPPPNDSDR